VRKEADSDALQNNPKRKDQDQALDFEKKRFVCIFGALFSSP
jgi:hypothetical protein